MVTLFVANPFLHLFWNHLAPARCSERSDLKVWAVGALPMDNFFLYCAGMGSAGTQITMFQPISPSKLEWSMFIFTLCTPCLFLESQSSYCCAIPNFFYELSWSTAGYLSSWRFFNLGLKNQKLFPGCRDYYLTLDLKYTEESHTGFYNILFQPCFFFSFNNTLGVLSILHIG